MQQYPNGPPQYVQSPAQRQQEQLQQSQAYGASAPGYAGISAPPAGYGAPQAGYGAPQAGYGAPQAGYGAPMSQSLYRPPAMGSGQPPAYPGGAPASGPLPPVVSSRPPLTSAPSLAMPTSTLELSMKALNLADTDVLSKSDPFCVLFLKSTTGRWVEIGRTEVVTDNLNPEWERKFVVNYSFEERQEVKFEVYDSDSDTLTLENHDFLGRCETTLGTVVSSGREFVAVLKDGPRMNNGKIVVVGEELESNKETIKMQLAGKNLDKKDFFGKSDPYFVISKSTSTGQYVLVHKSEVIKNTLNPTWAPFNKSVRDLCNNKEDRQLRFDVYDWNASGEPDFIGSFKTDLKTLKTAAIEERKFPLINEKKLSKKKYKNSGEIYVKNIQVEHEISFLDYIKGGTEMNFSVAVDFTASNGHPQDPRSLHYLHPGFADNQYTLAIKAVGSIIEDYDTDKLFPGLGFGARVPPSGQVSHEFFLNLQQDNPYCNRVDGLLLAYLNALHNVTLYGPTNFSPVIKHVARFAQAYQDGRQYFVLLIITDGIITDIDATKLAIIDASKYPMSIIIVGVGNEDFSAMEALDSDDKLLQFSGRVATRDIVQFVEMRNFVRGNVWDKELLAKEVLAEIPGQVTGWMKMRGIKPVAQNTHN